MTSAPRLRNAARALVLDERDHVLLVNFHWPGLDIDGGFWACPGGGIDPGETPEAAVRRELREEVGLTECEIAGAVWRLTRLFAMTAWGGQHFDGQTDTTYLVRVAHFEPQPQVDLLAEHVHGVRWFSPDEVAAGEVVFSPRDLREQMAIVLRQGVPDEPRTIAAL